MGVFFIALLTKKPELTFEQFFTHYRERHAPLVAPLLKKHGVINYTQYHVSEFLKSEFAKVLGGDQSLIIKADAVAVMEFANMNQPGQMISDPYYLEVVREDHDRFIAESPPMNTLFTLAEGRPIIVNGEAQIDVSEFDSIWKKYEKRVEATNSSIEKENGVPDRVADGSKAPGHVIGLRN